MEPPYPSERDSIMAIVYIVEDDATLRDELAHLLELCLLYTSQ